MEMGKEILKHNLTSDTTSYNDWRMTDYDKKEASDGREHRTTTQVSEK